MPEILNRKDFPGRLPPNTVLVDRKTPFGNPFHLGRDGDRDEVCDKFEAWVWTQPELIRKIREELRGRHLMCHCVENDRYVRCHAETIRKIANPESGFHNHL